MRRSLWITTRHLGHELEVYRTVGTGEVARWAANVRTESA
jgi:hypothetical protein